MPYVHPLRFERHRQLARRRVGAGAPAAAAVHWPRRRPPAACPGEVSGLHPFSDLRGGTVAGRSTCSCALASELTRRCHHKLEATAGNALPRNIIENNHTRRWTGRPCLGICRVSRRAPRTPPPTHPPPRARTRRAAGGAHRPRRARRARALSSHERRQRPRCQRLRQQPGGPPPARRAPPTRPRAAPTRGSIHVSATAGGGGGGHRRGRRRRPPPGW